MRKKRWILAAIAAWFWGTSAAQQGDVLTEEQFRGALVACLEQVSQGAGPTRTRRDLLALAACLQDRAAVSQPSVLGNADIIALTEQGVPANEIIATIRQRQTNFDTSVQQVLNLVRAGVDASVIEAMEAAGAAAGGQGVPAISQRIPPRGQWEGPPGGSRPLSNPDPLSQNMQRGAESIIGYTRRIRDAMSPTGYRAFSDPLRSGGRGPEMVELPAGRFEMGCISGGCRSDERPVHAVQFSQPFAIGRYEVTFAQWDACAASGACGRHRPGDQGWGRGNRPVINVSQRDAEAFVRWLTQETGERYRLPSEAEWEYAARGGASTRYPWGDDIGRNRANCSDCGSIWDDNQTAPVGSFPPNNFGLHDMNGNVWERVADCWNSSYSRAPSDGRAWMRGNCRRNVLRGGSWGNAGKDLRSANRNENTAETRSDSLGFRVARDLAR